LPGGGARQNARPAVGWRLSRNSTNGGSDMRQRVTGGRGRRKPAPVSRARRRAQQQAVRRRLRGAGAAGGRAAVEAGVEAEVTALLGRPGYARGGTAPLGPAGVVCSRCGQDWAPRLVRAGHYPRTLLTALAAVELRVPRVGCRCRGTVPVEFATLGRYERVWGDLQERARQLAGLWLSLQGARRALAWDDRRPA